MMPAPAVHATPDYPLCWGTVGWGADDPNAYDMGTEANDGAILVNVTLFRGRDSTKKLDQAAGLAQGQRLRCKLASNLLMLPPLRSRVAVALLQPSPYAPGGSLVVACDNPNPGKFGVLKAGELGIGGAATQGRIFFLSDGSVNLDGFLVVIVPASDAPGTGLPTAVGAAARVGDAVGPWTIIKGSTKVTIGG